MLHAGTRTAHNAYATQVKANFNVKLFALNVVIRIPLPPNTAVAKVTVAAGKAKFEPENQALVWRYCVACMCAACCMNGVRCLLQDACWMLYVW
jgi:hypothetical protein